MDNNRQEENPMQTQRDTPSPEQAQGPNPPAPREPFKSGDLEDIGFKVDEIGLLVKMAHENAGSYHPAEEQTDRLEAPLNAIRTAIPLLHNEIRDGVHRMMVRE